MSGGTARGMRFDLAWSFPQAEFQLPGERSPWYLAESFPKEAQARHRMRELDGFAAAFNGCMALYRVEFDVDSVYAELMIHKTGRDARPPRRYEVRPAGKAVVAALASMAARWKKQGGNDIDARISAKPVRLRVGSAKRARGESGHVMACTCLMVMILSGAAYAYRDAVYDLAGWSRGGASLAAPAADPRRYDKTTYAMPNSEGSCDRMILDNRNGRIGYAGRMDCDELRRKAAAETGSEDTRSASRAALSGAFRKGR